MKIKFNGSLAVVRSIGEFTWHAANNHSAEVTDPAICANLLTAKGEFSLAQDEPLLQVAEENDIIALAMQGIGTLAELAALDGKSIKALTGLTGKSAKQIKAWVKQAKQLTEVNHE